MSRVGARSPVLDRPSPGARWSVLAVTLVAAAGLCRMTSGGLGGPALGPLLATAVVGFAVPALLLRARVVASLAALVGTVALVVVAVETAVLRTSVSWFPTGAALRALATDLRQARSPLATFQLPLHAGPGVVLLGAVTTGLAGLAGGLLLGPLPTRRPQPAPALALVPALGLVAWSCAARPGTGAAVLAAVYVGAATPALAGLAVRRAGPHDAATGTARNRPGPPGGAVLLGLLAMAAAVGIGIPLGTAASGSAGAGGGNAAVVPASTLSLAAGLQRVQRDDAGDLLFTARSPQPTYWQVGVDTVWQNDQWVPGPTTTAVLAGAGAPPAPASSDGGRHFTTTVTIAHLSSRFLPVPPATVQVQGASGARITDAGVLSPSPSTPGQSYTATALDTNVYGAGSTGVTGPSGLEAAVLAPYLALPSIPAPVRILALQVTASAASPLGRAEELVNWFRSGQFHYTLTPPAAPAGTDPLVEFLTVTRAGSCESFAGAFAVMARSLGLPTRVAVGFTAGQTSGGVTSVRGADAHAWPEVYLGATLGWVSFEPTPAQPSTGIAPSDVVGPTVAPVTIPTTPTGPGATTLPTAPVTIPTTPSTATTTPSTTAPARPTVAQPWPALVVLLVVVVVVLGALALVATRRRRRRRRAGPGQRVVNAYRRVEGALAKAGLARPANRTPATHARTLLEVADRSTWTGPTRSADQLLSALRELRDLAQLVEQAGYSPRPVTVAEATAAEAAATRIRRVLGRPAVRLCAGALPTGVPTRLP